MGLMARPLPGQPALLLGVCLVRLEPCADWLLTFTLLRIEDARLAVAAAPVLLLVQMALLPLWLGSFPGSGLAGILCPDSMLESFHGCIVMPLSLALLTERLGPLGVCVHRWLALTRAFRSPTRRGSVCDRGGAHSSRKHCVAWSGYGFGGVSAIYRPGPVLGPLRAAATRNESGATREAVLQRQHTQLFRRVVAGAAVAGGSRGDRCRHCPSVHGRVGGMVGYLW
jgi:hypothetical protein